MKNNQVALQVQTGRRLWDTALNENHMVHIICRHTVYIFWKTTQEGITMITFGERN